MGKSTSGIPASPGTSRRIAQYNVTLPRRPSKEAIKVPATTTKPAENAPLPTSSNMPVVNSHEDATETHSVIYEYIRIFFVLLRSLKQRVNESQVKKFFLSDN